MVETSADGRPVHADARPGCVHLRATATVDESAHGTELAIWLMRPDSLSGLAPYGPSTANGRPRPASVGLPSTKEVFTVTVIILALCVVAVLGLLVLMRALDLVDKSLGKAKKTKG
jgi:hypothetical protein